MNILVTGSAGMIGSYVVKGLIEKGHTVIGVDRVKPKEELNGLKPVVLTVVFPVAVIILYFPCVK